MRWYIFALCFLALILTMSACVRQSPEQAEVIFKQDVELIATGLGNSNYELYEVDVEGGTCYVATGYQSVAVHCKED